MAGDDRAPQGERHHPRGGAARGSGGRRPGAPLRDVGGRPRPRPHCRARRTAAQTAGGRGLPLSGGAALSGGRGDHRRLGRRGPAGGRRRHRHAAKDLRAAGGARPQPVAPLGSPASRAQPAGEVRFTNSPSSVTRNVSRPPSPANCNGVTVPCTYARIGEMTGNLTGLLAAKGITTPFDVNADSAPVIYVHGQPGRSSSPVRSLERAAARLTGSDLATGHAVWLTRYLADPAELKILHMITGDPKRTPTVIDFANTDFFLSSGSPTCGKSCFGEDPTEAWNHGDVGSQINTTWLGMVGPGVAHLGAGNSVWSDHTNIQPTMMALLRLRDDYTPDGRVLGEVFNPADLPSGMRAHRAALLRLGKLYTQLEAPVGAFGKDTLRASTRALASSSAGDARYTRIENELQRLGARRDAVAARIHALLLGAAFDGRTLNVAQARALTRRGYRLLGAAAVLGA